MRVALPDVRSRDLKRTCGRGMAIVARLGYAAHGVVYGMVGVLALLSALGQSSGKTTGGQGAVQRLGHGGWGEPLLWAVAIGLACYALWHAIRALFDPEHAGHDGKALVTRVGYGVAAVTHALLATFAFQLARGVPTSGGDHNRSIGKLFSMPGGRIALGLVGLGVVGFGLFELFRAIKKRVGREFARSDLPAARYRLVMRIARMGHGARGVVFAIIGVSLIAAAIDAKPSEVHTIGDALHDLASQRFGSVLLGFVAIGLMAYGVHQLCVARYAQIPRNA